MDLKRSNTAYGGTFTTKADRGQKLVTPVGKDSSDWSGGKTKEIPGKMKMGGGMNNLSDTIGKDAAK